MHQASTTIGREKQLNLQCFARRSFSVSLIGLMLFCLSFVILPYLVSEANAETASANVSWGSISLELDPDSGNGNIDDEGHGDVNFGSIIPTAKSGENYGTLVVEKKTIEITSSGKYYSVFLSTNGDSNALNYSISETPSSIPAITGDGENDGSWDEPAKFVGNGWGFAVPGTPIPTSVSEEAFPSFGLSKIDFSSSDITEILGTQIIKTEGNSEAKNRLYSSSRWVAVPTFSAPQQIWKAESTSLNGFGTYENGNGVEVTGDTVNNKFDVYYAVMVNTGTLAGTYSNEIVYTALASTQAIDRVSNNILISTNIGGEGELETVSFELSSSASSIEESDIKIALVPHRELVAANYMELNDQTFSLEKLGHDLDYYLETFGACEIVDGSLKISNGADDLVSSVECSTPAITDWKNMSYEGSGNNQLGKGSYDFWMQIGKYGYNYLTRIEYTGNTYIPAFVYAGLQSAFSDYAIGVDTDGDGEEDVSVQHDPRYVAVASGSTNYETNKMISAMQEITPRICALTRRWGTETGDDARVYEPRTDINSRTTSREDAEANAKISVGTFQLEDSRDGKSYLVRRLADERCWMVSNLTFDPTIADITKANTDNPTDLFLEQIKTASASSEDVAPCNQDSAECVERVWLYAGSRYSYNWYTATAGNGTYELLEDAAGSICPKNWQLPGGGYGDKIGFLNLMNLYSVPRDETGYTFLESLPLSFPTPANTDFYFSRTPQIRSSVYDLYYSTVRVNPVDSSAKFSGQRVRCIARD